MDDGLGASLTDPVLGGVPILRKVGCEFNYLYSTNSITNRIGILPITNTVKITQFFGK